MIFIILLSDVRQHARLVNAHPHPQPQPQVRGLREGFQSTLVTTRPYEISHRRETLRLCSLWEEVCGQIQPESPHEDAQGREESEALNTYFLHIYSVHTTYSFLLILITETKGIIM